MAKPSSVEASSPAKQPCGHTTQPGTASLDSSWPGTHAPGSGLEAQFGNVLTPHCLQKKVDEAMRLSQNITLKRTLLAEEFATAGNQRTFPPWPRTGGRGGGGGELEMVL